MLALAMPARVGAEGRKVALVIGNSKYLKVTPLINPGNDAADMRAVLAGLGFELISLIDASQSQMDDAVESFRLRLVGAEAGLFYYAGHGVQSQGVNYLIPVDANISAEYQLRSRTLDATMALEAMSVSGCPLNIVILDACRDNPFASMRSLGRGLTVMGAAPAGAIIVYATDPGKTALDGSGRNGVFTGSLLRHIGEVGVDVKAMFDRVGAEVSKATGNTQNPWISSKFYGTYYLAGVAVAGGTVAPEPAELGKKPVLTVQKSYGSMTIEARTAGTLYVNGASVGEVAVGSTARVDDVEVGQARLEMRYPGGQTETRTAEVKKGAVTAISFNYVKQPKAIENMVLVEGGTFQMGDSRGDGYGDERPVHYVTVSGFYLGKYEVTQREWRTLMGNNPSYVKGDDLPVERVSWYDAVSYCNKLSVSKGLVPCYTIDGKRVTCDFTKNGFRLPTEAEWEYAARGGRFSGGFKFTGNSILDAVGWYDANSKKKTHPVGQKQGNELGLHDMSGNVWEWCWDWYGSYTVGGQTDPLGATTGYKRVVRGGSWHSSEKLARVSYRSSFDTDYGSFQYDGGLRVAARAP
jgi:formylglycine-generating enzyme required for sulfatase activity